MRPDTAKRKLRVLIADDSTAVRQSLARLLSEIETVEVVGQAQDGAENLATIQTLKPDVVILDIQMPKRRGIEVLDVIHQEERAPKVIVLTNYSFVQYRTKCLKAGASFFFDKSTEFDQLPQALEQLSRAATIAGRPATDEVVNS